MINYDSNWSARSSLNPKTEQDFIILQAWAKKKVLEMFAGTEAGRRMTWLMNSKKSARDARK